jgi:hypothetical protein
MMTDRREALDGSDAIYFNLFQIPVSIILEGSHDAVSGKQFAIEKIAK